MNAKNSISTNRPGRLALGLLLMGAMTMANANPGRKPIVPGHFGYMMEVHTCNISDAGTDSTISTTLIGVANGKAVTSGPFKQDWTYWTFADGRIVSQYDDHEQNQWDTYFFAESTRLDSISQLLITSDGSGNKPGWCVDTIFVTRIEADIPVKTWVWYGPSPWIYKGNTVLNGIKENTIFIPYYGLLPWLRYPPAGLFTQYDLQVTQGYRNPNTSSGSVLFQYFAPTSACSTAKQFSTLVTGQPIQTKLVSGVQTAGYCLFEGTFSQVPWGQARIITPDASETIWVIPGGIVYVELQPGRYR